MTPVHVADLFKSFHQGDSSYTRRFGGTGLGLAISRQLCTLMGGDISVQSQVGKGSNFLVTVDLAVASLGLPIPSGERTDAEQKLVLIVDDSEVTRHTLSSMLHPDAFATREVSSGEEAIVALLDASQKNTPFDVVLMDWRLPKMDGMQTTRRIREQLPAAHQPIILIISAFKRDEVFAGREESCCDGFMLKPIDRTALFEKIQGLLNARRDTEERPKREPRDNAARLAGKSVLLVEDNEINRELAGELLGDLGIRVTFAADGLEGVRRVAENAFDLVLMDIQMPGLDGLSATRQIRAMENFEQLPIIAMTAHAMTGDRERSLEAGMNDHLTKPITPSGLTEMLLRWMPLDGDPSRSAPGPGGSQPPLPEDGLPEALPPFNLKAALERTNNKPKLLRKMLLTFHKQYADAAAQLRRQLAAGEQEAAHRLAHSLKGLAATLEASELTHAAMAVESAFRSGDTQAVAPLIDELESVLSPAVAAAGSLSPSDAEETGTPADAPKAVATPKRSILLVVDDESTEFDLLSAALGADYQLEHAQDGAAALNRAAQNPPDLILLDVMMPGIDGYEVCIRLKAMDITSQIPIIFITGANDPAAETRGLEVGGADYITKPFTPAVIRARIHTQLDLLEKQAKLSSLAATDALTGLANRRRFDEVLAYECARHARSGKQLGLILLDVDFFKLFNDNHGHLAGDDCLRQIARALTGVLVRNTDMIARYGGEEFALLMPETDLEGVLFVADKIVATMQRLAIPHGQSSIANYVTVSLGAVSARCFPGARNLELLALVDDQLYAAKAAGRNCVCAAHARFDESAREYVSEAFNGKRTAEAVPAGF
jgi:diguanylate cyclase (GGDEF)-like protein